MQFKKSISVIIPMYNSSHTIVRALESIRNQTQFDAIKEIIVVNDGSNDNSKILVEEYQKIYQEMPIVIINQSNGGVSRARNTGLRAARGFYIALLDADDEWLPRKTEIQLSIFRENTNIDFLGVSHSDKPLKILFKKIARLYKASIKDICIKCFPQTSTVIFKREILKMVGYYDENQCYAEDEKFFLKICTKCNYYYYPKKLVIYDNGKREFGGSGLSGNLKEMYLGHIKNLFELKENRQISKLFYCEMRVFYWIKYLRRILIVRRNNEKYRIKII